jgi:hypothetical protein
MSQRHMKLGKNASTVVQRGAGHEVGPVEYGGQRPRDRVARRVGPGGGKRRPSRVAQRAHTHPRDIFARDRPPSVPKVTGLRRHVHPSDRGVLAKDLDLGPRHLHLRAMERAAPAHQRPVEQRLERRGAGPVFRARDPLQGGGEKAKLRVAFDFGKARRGRCAGLP